MELTLILPHQLFKSHKVLEKKRPVMLVEHPHFFLKRKFHKQKLIFHRASMKAYAHFLEEKGFTVHYVECHSAEKKLKSLKEGEIFAIDPIEHPLWQEYEQIAKRVQSFKLFPSPMFLTTQDVKEAFIKKSDSHFSMQTFYILQRKSLDILMEKGGPVGGKWSFDEDNRKAFPKKGFVTPRTHAQKNKYTDEAVDYVEKHFKEHFGKSDLLFPIDFHSCELWLEHFLKERLSFFGDYEDAIVPDEHFLYHSGLSPLLNSGLLEPSFVVEKTLEFAKKHKTPLNSLEGFIRQIIGWREYMKLLYDIRGDELLLENGLKHVKKMPRSFWTASTQIEPIDHTIKKIEASCYAHHIERLMILGNFMLLCKIDPREVYEWFMCLFIDAYEWVMVTNVMSMSQYADLGKMTTKPYVSSSNYVLKMSHYSKGNWSSIWDALYWSFLKEHEKAFSKNARMGMMMMLLKKLSKEKLKEHLSLAEDFLKHLK